MALVIMRPTLDLSGAQRQHWLGAIQGLNLSFFVHRQHQGVVWWIQIKPDHVDHLIGEMGIVADLEGLDLLEKVQPHTLMVPRGDRTKSVIEPMLTDQWFVAMSKASPDNRYQPGQSIAGAALHAVTSGDIQLVPENWISTYTQWLENIQDWCISRQLWWGHQIPAWYDEDGNVYVASNEAEAQAQAPVGPPCSARHHHEEPIFSIKLASNALQSMDSHYYFYRIVSSSSVGHDLSHRLGRQQAAVAQAAHRGQTQTEHHQ